ncbi:MAG: 50S ribosomal protein L17 [Verrucomicrobiota bacterium]|nr:50S ribosomal protein L17 [Verrucomicrobiota bacterium]
MRHRIGTARLGRKSKHREAMLANMIASLIEHGRIKTTLAKAKAAKPLAERLVTMAKKGTLHSRRVAVSRLQGKEKIVAKLFTEVAPKQADRKGGYTRIIKIGPRNSDASEMAFLEFVEPAGVAASDIDPLKEIEKKSKTAPKSDDSK